MWRHSSGYDRMRCVDALRAMKSSPWHFVTLPPIQREHLLIREAAAEGWAHLLGEDPVYLDLLPESLRSHPRVERTLKALSEAARHSHVSGCLECVRAKPSLSDQELAGWKLPKTETQAWKQIDAWRLKYWKSAVKRDWRVWSSVPASLRQMEVVLAVMRQSLGPQIRLSAVLWDQLPECYRQDPCLQRVYSIATRLQSVSSG